MNTVTSTGITIFTRGPAFIRSLEICNIRFLFGEMVFKEGTVNDSMTESVFWGAGNRDSLCSDDRISNVLGALESAHGDEQDDIWF